MRKQWNKFFVNLFNGVVLMLPVVVTIAFIRFLVLQVNNIVLNPIMGFLPAIIKSPQHVYILKAVIFFIVLLSLALIGWGAKILVVKRIFSLGEKVLLKVPFMGKIYNTAKQIFSAVLGHGKTIFKQVVLVEYPRKGLYSVGFTTGDTKGELKKSIGKDAVNVFVPTTPNPTSGIFLVVPRESIHFLKMSVEEGMKLIISGGSVSPPGQGDEG